MSKLDCNIIQDLLPSFADSLVNEKTAVEIKEHLSDCEDCSKLYNEMIKGEDFEQKEAEKEINYLKKIKKKTKKIIVSILSALMIMIIIAIGLYSFIGMNDNAYSVNDIRVTDNLMSTEISLFSSANSITKVSAKEIDGIVTISVRSSLFSFNKKDSTEFGFMAEQSISKVQTADGRVLWENGERIPQKVSDIYNAKVKNISDNSEVNKLIDTIGIMNELKCESISIHFQTDKKPYGLEFYDIDSYDEIFSAFTTESYEQKIKSFAFILLACIENADYIQFDYITPDGSEKTYKLTVDEANDYLYIVKKGEDIKGLAASYSGLKLLIDNVGTELYISSQFEYSPYLIENQEMIDEITNNPIDKKYLNIHNNTPDFNVHNESENFLEWAKAYEKQYKIIYNAILGYAENNPDLESYIKESLIKAIHNIENYSEFNDAIADLYYNCQKAGAGIGSGLENTYCWIYLSEAREKTLRLAELAYFLDVDFEWIK